MAELTPLLQWSFLSETSVPKDIEAILVQNEVPHAAYKTIRDVAVLTNKRLIIADEQGITGKKTEIYTIPYKSIIMYSTENSGFFDMDSEIQLWTKAGIFKLSIGKGVDIRKIDSIIGSYIL